MGVHVLNAKFVVIPHNAALEKRKCSFDGLVRYWAGL